MTVSHILVSLNTLKRLIFAEMYFRVLIILHGLVSAVAKFTSIHICITYINCVHEWERRNHCKITESLQCVVIFNTSYKKAESFYEMETSSNVNLVIRAVLNSVFFFFFTKRFCTHKKHQKHKDADKQKHKNANKWISDFFPLDVFYAHKT